MPLLHDRERIHERLTSVSDPINFLINLFAHAPVGVAVWTADGRPLLTNKAFMDLFLSEPPPDYNVLTDEVLAANGMLPLFQRAFRGETVHVPTFWYDPRENTALGITEGRRVAISMTIFPLLKPDGSLDYVAATYKDETDVTLANERLRLGEQRERLAQQASRVGTFELDLQTGVNTWSPELEAMYGLAPGEFGATQHSWEQLVHSQDRAEAVARVQRAFDTRQPVEGEWRVVWRDGTVRWLEGRFQVVTGEDGTPRRLIGVNIDITDRKLGEAQLRESEARRAAVMDAALDGIVLMDDQGIVTDFNAAAERTFGFTRAEALGKPLADLMIPVELRAAHVDGLRRYRESGHGPLVGMRVEVPALRSDGSEFPAEVAIVRIVSDGPPVFTGYIRDITERRRAAEAEVLRRAKEAAEEANAELEAFSYSVAHDLRTPLRAINGFSTALREDWADKLGAEADEMLGRIIAGSDRMSHLIDALLSLSRLTRAEVRRERIDLGELVANVIGQLRVADPARVVELLVPSNLIARGDPQLLRALVENLVGNAWKFTAGRDPARIEVGLDETSYFVRDNGAGFDMNHAAALFVPFRRLHTAREFEGSGIGLATVQRIVRRHGGRAWAEGAVGRGATFRFTLSEERTHGWAPAR